jgi:hypothetical protein
VRPTTGQMGVRCSWARTKPFEAAPFPDAVAFHAGHDSSDLSGCDAWECLVCGNTSNAQGFFPCDEDGDHGFWRCDGCGQILTSTGERWQP